MKSFLEETAQDIIKKHKSRLSRVCFVFPNKRTKLFFRKYYSGLIGKTSWAPDMLTLRQVVRKFSGFEEPDKLSLIYDLYDVYNKIDNALKYNFNDFYRLGEVLINDFNEIDSWLVNPDEIYKNLKDIHDIENYFDWLDDDKKETLKNYWKNFSDDKTSPEKEKFSSFWKLLPIVYKEYTNILKSRKIGYNGLIFRTVSQLIDANSLNTNKYEKYIFIGYNALNKSEEKLISFLKDNNKAVIYWDTDAYYHNNKQQEAGDFLRKNFKNLKIKDYPIPDNFNKQNKNIDIIGVPLEVGQAKIIPKILKEYKVDKSGENTAIILSDEHLLFSVLHSLPPHIEKINVTMGYPLKATSLFNLLKQYIKLHTNLQRNKTGLFYYKDVVSLLKHPLILHLSKDNSEELISEIEEKNMVYIKSEYIFENSDNNQIINLIFQKLSSDNQEDNLLANLLNLLYFLFNKDKNESGKNIQTVENEFIYKAYTAIKRFREVVINRNIKLKLKLMSELLNQIVDAQQVPFTGDAVDGLQLMGVLETRNLDFENLIILGVNEGNFPAVSNSPTFISQSIRYAFDLPLIKYQDSVYAYLFYRLLQRAKNITLVYNNIINDSNAGEMSRFLMQLINETNLKITHKQLNQNLVPAKSEPIVIPKNDEIINTLKDYIYTSGNCKRRLSASAINTYIDCPLKFYFQYVANLRKPDEVEEEISHAAFGTILHDSLENIYKDIESVKNSNVINIDDFRNLDKKIPTYIEKSFKDYYEHRTDDFIFKGNQIIIKEVLAKYVSSVLEIDKKHAPFEIVSLEEKYGYKSEIDAEINGKIRKIGIRGIIDRVDKKDNIYRVIDYKTGKADKTFNGVPKLFDPENKNRNKHILQTFLYSYLFIDINSPLKIDVVPCIYDVRTMNRPNFKPYLDLKVGREIIEVNSEMLKELMPDFKTELSYTISELFDTDIPFTQTNNEKICEWCNFKTLCSKV